MRQKKNEPIVIPMEFKVACCLYKMDVAEVLQVFIDHVTIYDIINKTYHEGFSEACHCLIFCNKKKKARIVSKGMKKCREIFLRNMRQIEILANMKRRGWKTTTKRSYTRCFVENIFDAMERLHAPSDIIYLNEFSCLKLSKDFCVLCEVYDCYPKEFLEYFMSYISVADADVGYCLKGYSNFIHSFFLKISSGLGRNPNRKIELTDWEIDFYDRLEELRLEIYIIRKIRKRIEILQDFYFTHYQYMNPN